MFARHFVTDSLFPPFFVVICLPLTIRLAAAVIVMTSISRHFRNVNIRGHMPPFSLILENRPPSRQILGSRLPITIRLTAAVVATSRKDILTHHMSC